MFGGIWNFFKRHKKKFIFSGVLFGGGWLGYKYMIKKIKEIREEEEKEYMNVVRRQHHFESNQRTCNMTVLSMIPNIRDILINKLNTENVTSQLKQQPENKLELWGVLKISSFARTISAVYGCILMSLVLRVQLNVIGGYIFLESSPEALNGCTGRKRKTTKAVQERYLSLIKYFVGPGLEELTDVVYTATCKELERVSLRDKVTLDNTQSIIRHVRDRMETSDHILTKPFTSYLLPAEQIPDIEVVNAEDELYDKLITETRDILDSCDFQSVVTVCLDRGFSKLYDYIAEHYKHTAQSKADIHEVNIPLAKLVPVINGLLYKIVADAPNNFIQELLLVEDVKKMAGNVYEAFSQETQN